MCMYGDHSTLHQFVARYAQSDVSILDTAGTTRSLGSTTRCLGPALMAKIDILQPLDRYF
jgi:hypothetical protein